MARNGFDDHLLALGKRVIGLLAARGVPHADAEDAVGTAFERIYVLLPTLDVQNLDGWFYRVALNAYLDALRHRRREQLTARVPEPAASAPEHFSTLVEAAAPADRELLALKYYYGFSVAEIAAALALPPETVKKRLQRSRSRLGAALKEEDHGS
ncbi:RNA polymerase sigma factor [Lacticaseibacillus parakribbianus]|uniref:RNA polymerase sigma factor n=1 Tax=Lacticaseibacillus parakribbianus TaxID=2970927 RepID=UPI0021CB95B4|nr:sigma-70 family RNA polymerase sigma factor [Lacticaseibacillus parakribbianus]